VPYKGGLTRGKIAIVLSNGEEKWVGGWVVVLGGGVVKLGWVGEEKREQRRKERCPCTDQPGLLLHLNCMTSRHAEAPVAENKQNHFGVKWAVSETASCRRLHVTESAFTELKM
jgi:hypothetical protein